MQIAEKESRNFQTMDISREIDKTLNLLGDGCNWADSLCQGIEGFTITYMEVGSSLGRLKDIYENGSLSRQTLEEVRHALREIREYSRYMKDESRPLTICGIIEDAQGINEQLSALSTLLDRIAARSEITRSRQ